MFAQSTQINVKKKSTYAQSDINGLAVCKNKNEFKIKHKYIFKVPGFKVGNILFYFFLLHSHKRWTSSNSLEPSFEC